MKIKAIGLFSGGLDSVLASRMMKEQGIDVVAINFITTFFGDEDKLKKIAEKNNINLKIVDVSRQYLNIVKKPKHGYGRAMNPCIDCKIFMLKKAKEIARKEKAKFIFTGEVLGQRPMSQRLDPLIRIEKEAGLSGELLRPLSAKNLKETTAEKNNWVDREQLMDISGRSRKQQLELVLKYGIKDYFPPAGGCCLTEMGYSAKVRDLMDNQKNTTINDLKLLKIKRHFRVGKSKIISGSNKEENEELLKLKKLGDIIFKAKDTVGPIVLLRGARTKEAIKTAAAITARYSDDENKEIRIEFGGLIKKIIKTEKIKEEDLKNVRIEQLR